jgi:hypothetical protein
MGKTIVSWAWWHIPVIPVAWKAETGGMKIQAQPGLPNETLSRKYSIDFYIAA